MAKVMVLASFSESLVVFRGALLKAMQQKGHRVIAVGPPAGRPTVEALHDLGVEFREYPLQRSGLNPFKDTNSFVKLCRLIKHVRPDVFFAYTVKPVIYGSLAASLVGVPRKAAMITGLGYAFLATTLRGRLTARVVRSLYRLGLKGVQVVFFQNPDDERTFRNSSILRAGQRTVVVNGSGVDLAAYSQAPLPDKPVFLLIARLLVDKGVREYVQAARRVKQRHPAARFQLVGWIDENPNAISPRELEEWQEQGLIEYYGRVEDVRPRIRDCAVYVLPSYSEGTPRTVLEAMAMGRPIITSDAPGCRETVREGINGFLVPPRDADALAERMERFIKTPRLIPAMGQESRKLAEERYDVHAVNRVMLEELGL